MSIGKRIASARSAHVPRLTQAKLARSLGVTPQAVSGWERGESVPETDKIGKLARILDVEPGWLVGFAGHGASMIDDGEAQTVPLKGYVAAGAEAHFLPLADGELDRVPAPAGSSARTVALEVRGSSLGPLFDRWLVFFDEVRSPVTPDLIGKICVVGLVDGRILVKKIRQGARGLYDLVSNADEPIRGVAIEWAARVKTMVPQ